MASRVRAAVATRRRRDRARNEAEILQAAERTFASKGFEGATMAAIAAEAGFAVGTLYNLFASKEALLAALLAARIEAVAAETAAAIAAAPSPRAKLEAYAAARVRFMARHRAFFRLYLSEVPGVFRDVGRPGPKAVALVLRQRKRLAALFALLPRARLDAPTRALLFDAALRAFTAERVLSARRPPADEEVRAVVEGLLEGLG